MSLDLRPSRACLALVQRFEGLRPRAARLADGGWTLGYGHTLTAREGGEVSPEDARDLLLYDLTRTGEVVRELTFTPLNQNQFDALTAFAFNIGVDKFRVSAVLKRVNQGDLLGAAAALEGWRVAAFEGEDLVIDGLVRRRAAEKAMFLTPPEGFRFVPTPVLRPILGPADATSAAVAELESPMDGELAVAERVRPPEPIEPSAPVPAVEAAAGAVASRIRRLFPEPAEPSGSGAEAEPALPGDLPPFPAGAPAAAPSEPPPPPFPTAATGEPPDGTEPLFPHAEAPPPPLPTDAPSKAALDPFGGAPGEPPVAAEPRGFVEEARGAPGPARARVYAGVGLLGLALFALAIVWMLGGRATSLNLLLGLAGVVCMAPAGAALVLPWLNRGGDRARD